VQRTPGRPSTYKATSPNRGLSLLIGRYRKRLVDLERKKADLVKSLYLCRYNQDDVVQGRFSVITGADNVVSKAKQMISHAEHEYAAIMSSYALKRAKEDGVERAIVAARKRNLRVRIISEIDHSNSAAADNLSKYAELRRNTGLLFYIDIFDRKQILFGPAITDEELKSSVRSDKDLWTDNSQFVAGICALFEHLWRASVKYERTA